MSVWALGSTDSGVSWIVETEGRRIFHAGDLNNLYARFLPEAVPGEIIYSEEFDEEIDPYGAPLSLPLSFGRVSVFEALSFGVESM